MTARPAFLPERITLEDVAERLAKINRFAGGTRSFYSVAQHCVIVAEALADDPRAALYGLLHDAHEAWIGDIPTTVAAELLIYRRTVGDLTSVLDPLGALKLRCDRAILGDLGFEPMPLAIAARVRDADARAFLTEERDVALPLVLKVTPCVNAFSKPITCCWPWPKAEEKFIETFDRFARLANLPARKRRAA